MAVLVKCCDFQTRAVVGSNRLVDRWDVSFQGSLDRETCVGIIGCQAQMYLFDFFYGLNLAHRFCAMTDNLSKTIQKERFSANYFERI